MENSSISSSHRRNKVNTLYEITLRTSFKANKKCYLANLYNVCIMNDSTIQLKLNKELRDVAFASQVTNSIALVTNDCLTTLASIVMYPEFRNVLFFVDCTKAVTDVTTGKEKQLYEWYDCTKLGNMLRSVEIPIIASTICRLYYGDNYIQFSTDVLEDSIANDIMRLINGDLNNTDHFTCFMCKKPSYFVLACDKCNSSYCQDCLQKSDNFLLLQENLYGIQCQHSKCDHMIPVRSCTGYKIDITDESVEGRSNKNYITTTTPPQDVDN